MPAAPCRVVRIKRLGPLEAPQAFELTKNVADSSV